MRDRRNLQQALRDPTYDDLPLLLESLSEVAPHQTYQYERAFSRLGDTCYQRLVEELRKLNDYLASLPDEPAELSPRRSCKSARLRLNLLTVLAEMPLAPAKQELLRGVNDPHVEVRRRSLWALTNRDDVTELSELSLRLEDEDKQVRFHAAKLLEKADWGPRDPRHRALLNVTLSRFGAAATEGVAAITPLLAVIYDTWRGSEVVKALEGIVAECAPEITAEDLLTIVRLGRVTDTVNMASPEAQWPDEREYDVDTLQLKRLVRAELWRRGRIHKALRWMKRLFTTSRGGPQRE